MSQIKIQIIGAPHSGCTTIGLLIQEALEKAGFTSHDFITDTHSLMLCDKELQQMRINSINKKVDVRIEEVHTRKLTDNIAYTPEEHYLATKCFTAKIDFQGRVCKAWIPNTCKEQFNKIPSMSIQRSYLAIKIIDSTTDEVLKSRVV